MDRYVKKVMMGMVVGTTSICAGYGLYWYSQQRTLSPYYQQFRQFRDFNDLRKYLENCPGNTANVLVEGKVEKSRECVWINNNPGPSIEAAAGITTNTTASETETEPIWKICSTIDEKNISRPFKLMDHSGKSDGIIVKSIHEAGGIRKILTRQCKTIYEIPSSTSTRSFILSFGASVGAYGSAALNRNIDGSRLPGGDVTFTPVAVDSSIEELESVGKNQSMLKFLSFIFLGAGGGVLFISALYFIFKFLWNTYRRRQEDRRLNRDADNI